MSALADINELQSKCIALPEMLTRHASKSCEPDVFSDIYRDDINIVIWQRELSAQLALAANEILKAEARLEIAEVVTAKNVHSKLCKALGETDAVKVLSDDITLFGGYVLLCIRPQKGWITINCPRSCYVPQISL
jgi:hypothetical protein